MGEDEDMFDTNPSLKVTKERSGQRAKFSKETSMYMYEFPGGSGGGGRKSFKSSSQVGFDEDNRKTLAKSTLNGMAKEQIRMKSIVSFGNGNIQRLKGDSFQKKGNNLPTLLCLHGWRSNKAISEFHMENLGIKNKFNIVYLNGTIQSNQAANTAISILAAGPYFSWADQDQKDDSETDVKKIIESLKSLLLHLLLVPNSRTISCYDAVFGFSQAVPLISLLSYEPLRNRVLNDMGYDQPLGRLPWRFVIGACGANMNIFKKVMEHYKLPFENIKIPLPGTHIIGIQDQFKMQSEEIMCLFPLEETLTFYLDSGHEIPALTQRLDYIPSEIVEWFKEKVQYFKAQDDIESGKKTLSYYDVSMIDTVYDMHECMSPVGYKEENIGSAVIGMGRQYALNDIGVLKDTLLDMLRDADPVSPALYSPGSPPLTYGGLLKFIHGEGDMRRIGANHNFTVAYLAPLGAVSAVAFLTIACQCTAAPLDPAYTVEALLLAFEQL